MQTIKKSVIFLKLSIVLKLRTLSIYMFLSLIYFFFFGEHATCHLLILSLTLCLLGNFSRFFSYADFFQNQLFKKSFQEFHQSVKQF